MAGHEAVKVAVRVRPLIQKEVSEGARPCLDILHNNQVNFLNNEKAYTFDYSFASGTSQEFVYKKAVSKLTKELIKGYNVTILAYGQTGSGKTHTMGTSVTTEVDECDLGIIPRAVKDIFQYIQDEETKNIIVKASFIELYKESLHDLLSINSQEDNLDIREDANNEIIITGLTEVEVDSLASTFRCLEQGGANRVTGSTAMNKYSSRSHAIFTLNLQITDKESNETITGKFHLVDLAGSERVKKTKAVGERFKEGVNINQGLLALGNVISALCENAQKRGGHIPYRNSKLTRLLQNSLGGNSFTLMIACVSPADTNYEETLSTLRYADRAKRIKNRPTVNRDPHAAEIAALKKEVQDLRLQLLSTGVEIRGQMIPLNENQLKDDRMKIKLLEEEIDKLTRALQSALCESANLNEKDLLSDMAFEDVKKLLDEFQAQTESALDVLNQSVINGDSNPTVIELICKFKAIQEKVIFLQDDLVKRKTAILDQDLSFHNGAVNTSRPCKIENNISAENIFDDENSDDESPKKADVFGTTFTLKRAERNEELHELNRALAEKEQLMCKISTNNDHLLQMNNVTYEKDQKELEERSKELMKEKELIKQTLHSGAASKKIAEQRRKKIGELEGKVSELRKKIIEQSKLIKIKEQSEQKVTKLSTEISTMKSSRIKLIKQIKEDNEKFKKCMAQKDREVEKLKVADRKKQFQMVKMERLHNKQQNVLKMKMEEAAAINKRLKDALALQKMCQQKRNDTKNLASVNEKVKCWLTGELEVVVVTKEARKSLETLIEDRKRIFEQLQKVTLQLDKQNLSHTILKELSKKKEDLKKELEFRTAQISDLQSKIADEDEIAVKKSLDNIQTMVEAKSAVQFLFESASTSRADVLAKEVQMKELQNQYEEMSKTLEELNSHLKEKEEEHQRNINCLNREYEEKTLFLLRRTYSKGEKPSESISTGLIEEIERFSCIEEESERLMTENDELKRRNKFLEEKYAKLKMLTGENSLSKKRSSQDSSSQEISMDESTITLRKKIPKKNEEDDTSTFVNESKCDVTQEVSFNSISCKCTKKCSTKQCKCFKSDKKCSVTCRCAPLMCTNIQNKPVSFIQPSREVSVNLNSTYNVLGIEAPEIEPLQETTNKRAPKRRRKDKAEALNKSFDEGEVPISQSKVDQTIGAEALFQNVPDVNTFYASMPPLTPARRSQEDGWLQIPRSYERIQIKIVKTMSSINF